jgi:hypothetical protein
MPDNRLAQLKDLLVDAKSVGDDDKVKEIETEMFQMYGFDNKTGRVKKAMGGNLAKLAKKEEKEYEKRKNPDAEFAQFSGGGAVMDATSNRATNGKICRGGGAALRGLKFRGLR